LILFGSNEFKDGGVGWPTSCARSLLWVAVRVDHWSFDGLVGAGFVGIVHLAVCGSLPEFCSYCQILRSTASLCLSDSSSRMSYVLELVVRLCVQTGLLAGHSLVCRVL